MLLSPCDHFKTCKKPQSRQVTMNGNDIEEKEEKEVKESDEPHNGKSSDNSVSIDLDNEPNAENKSKELRHNSDEDKCFLCLKSAEYQCQKCRLPYCCQAHYDLHTDSSEYNYSEKSESNDCFPFRVLEKPEVTGELSQKL